MSECHCKKQTTLVHRPKHDGYTEVFARGGGKAPSFLDKEGILMNMDVQIDPKYQRQFL